VCLFEREDYDLANELFSEYLATSQPKYFQQAIEYKFYMANAFRQGAYRRPFTSKQFPKILPGRNLAYRLYDEVVQSVPCHELAAESLWAKANMLWEDYLYRESVDTFQSLIRRFPKHELTPKAYLAINQVYGDEAEWEYQNPDLLQLAEINTKKFELAFPRDDRLQEARDGVLALKETYAKGLWDTGRFYEGQGYLVAAKLYYQNALEQFAGTSVAERCRNRILSLTDE
jgi:outer membrane protein assembly factor BamD (BamD/ComL family)